MSIQRWNPFAEMLSLREAMARLMEESVVRPGEVAQPSGGPMLGAAVDLRERDDAYVLEASLPGMKPEDIDVSILGDRITIQGEQKDQQEREQGRYYLRERRVGRFQRTIALPASVQADQVSCDFTNGVLTVTLPKSEESRPRRIPIAGRLPDLEAQTPGLDTQRARQTAADARAFYEGRGQAGDAAPDEGWSEASTRPIESEAGAEEQH